MYSISKNILIKLILIEKVDRGTKISWQCLLYRKMNHKTHSLQFSVEKLEIKYLERCIIREHINNKQLANVSIKMHRVRSILVSHNARIRHFITKWLHVALNKKYY